MKTLAEFTKTTLIGGVLIILPIYVAVLLLAKAVKGILALLAPSQRSSRPTSSSARSCHPLLVAALLRRRPARPHRPGLRAKIAFEQVVLEKLPGYTFLRGLPNGLPAAARSTR